MLYRHGPSFGRSQYPAVGARPLQKSGLCRGTPCRARPCRASFNVDGDDERKSSTGSTDGGEAVRSLLIDNYDSYSYNLYQLLAVVNGVEPFVVFNDDDGGDLW